MGRHERNQFFDRLCELRDGAGKSPDDMHGTISIEDVIIYADAVMVALEEHDREIGLELAAASDAASAAAPDEPGSLDLDPFESSPPPATTTAATDTASGSPLDPPIGSGPLDRFHGDPDRNRP